ncbi:MAG: RagB/SusD family nutrient uptake outer membrane protein, partial [Bacteroidales bacterium]|nr:RagB/SusD family nutrient uptake outer membrane protein [Bacteroidales bacterium]
TRTDGNVTDYDGFKASHDYLHFDTPSQIFEGKDARLWATCILPGTTFRDKTITIQAGYVARNGSATYEGSSNTSITVGDKTYYQYGAASSDDYSGFDQSQHFVMTRTGFSYKKFLSTKALKENELGKNTNSYPIMRYAEVLLTYAEAVFESGEGDPALARSCLNATRRRAGHTTDIDLTSDNIQRERRVELAFENDRFWTLIRRREFQNVFASGSRKALDPLLDLRVDPPKYIFVRKVVLKEVPHTWENKNYYLAIPGTASNGCIQNPQW